MGLGAWCQTYQPQDDLVSQHRTGKSYSGRLSSDLPPFSDMCPNPLQKKYLDFNKLRLCNKINITKNNIIPKWKEVS